MIALDVLLAFVAATAILIAIPGPNVALIVANSVAHGTRYGLLTVAGIASGVVVQLALTVVGASAALDFLAAGFEVLRWLGVVYLVWLGVAGLARAAGRLRVMLAVHARLRNRLTGGLLMGAGLGLALARRP